MSALFSTPKTPTPAAPPAVQDAAGAAVDAAAQVRARAASQQGRRSTLLVTNPAPAPDARKTLLGA